MQCVGRRGDGAAGLPPMWVVTSTFSDVLVPNRACPCTVAILVTAGLQSGDLGCARHGQHQALRALSYDDGVVQDALQHFRASGAMSPVFGNGVVWDVLHRLWPLLWWVGVHLVKAMLVSVPASTATTPLGVVILLGGDIIAGLLVKTLPVLGKWRWRLCDITVSLLEASF